MLNPDAKFWIERELDRFVQDLQIMTHVTDRLFTGVFNPNSPEPDGQRIVWGHGWAVSFPTSR